MQKVFQLQQINQHQSKAINMLEEQFEELKKRKPLSDDEEEPSEDMFVQSQFLLLVLDPCLIRAIPVTS